MGKCYQDTECDKQPLLSVKGGKKKRKKTCEVIYNGTS